MEAAGFVVLDELDAAGVEVVSDFFAGAFFLSPEDALLAFASALESVW